MSIYRETWYNMKIHMYSYVLCHQIATYNNIPEIYKSIREEARDYMQYENRDMPVLFLCHLTKKNRSPYRSIDYLQNHTRAQPIYDAS